MSKIKLLSFDCYGTLIDWETGMVNALENIREKYGLQADLQRLVDRYVQIELEVEQESYRKYSEVLTISLTRLLNEIGVTPEPDDASLFVKTLPTWPPFPETAGVLKSLKEMGYRLAILSNIDNDLIAQSVKLIGIDFDYIVTAEMTRSYKPAPGHWHVLLQVSGMGKDEILHVAASIEHDIRPAKRLGFRVAWINRRGEQKPSNVEPDYTLPNLKPLPTILQDR